MAKAKRPEPSSNRSGMDYYEYKRQHDMVRMRQRAVEVAGDVERPEDLLALEAEDQRGVQRFGKLFAGLKRTPKEEAPESIEDAALEPAVERAIPEAIAQEPVQIVAQHKDDPDEANAENEAPDAALDLVQLELQDEDGEGDDIEITNPFAGALDKLKLFGSKLASGTTALRQRMAKPEREDDEDEDDEPPPQAETAIPSLTMALSDDDDAPPRRRRSNAVHMVSNEDEDSEDPLGVMRPMDERTHLAFMRPDAQNQSGVDHTPDQAVLSDSVTREGNPMNDNEMTRPELTEKLMDDLNNVPALSRRERKAMASAGTLIKPATKTQVEDEDDGDVPVRVDEPTQQFKPLRARPVKPAPTSDVDDEDEDDEDDIAPKKSRFGGFGGKKRRVYRDEDLDDEEDDDYEDDAGYDEDDYDEDEDSEEEYDDYDEDEAFGSAYHVSFGKRVLGFLKGILILTLIFLLVVVALRQLEASKVLSLNIVRETIGQIIPIDNLLPPPNDEGTQPIVSPLTEDVTPEPAQTQEPTPSPAPIATPAPESEPVIDPGAQGNPLEQEGDALEEGALEEDASMQGAPNPILL